jgi:aromatic-L-amino-acid decarboxylase
MEHDAAETGAFDQYLARLGPQLDAFLRFDHGDAAERQDAWTAALDGPLPENGIGVDAVADELERTVIPNGAAMSHPRFYGWITTGPSTIAAVTAAASMVAAPQRYTITAFNHLEELSLQWLAQLCGLPEHMRGVYSSGGSVANLVALGAARQFAFEQRGVDPAADGVGTAQVAVYTSVEAHHSVHRSAAVLGLGRSSVRAVPVDDRQRMDVDALAAMIETDVAAGVLPVAVVAAAGTTNTGAVDPLLAAGEVARGHGIWFHVDGAYGLVGVLDDRVAPLYDGLELADSAIVDPHKWMGAPVGIAATFVRDRALLHRAFTQGPSDYLEGAFADADDVEVSVDSMGIPYGDLGVELSAPSRGVVVWGILREIGAAGMRARVRRHNDFARFVAEEARAHPRLEVLTEPVLSICCFRYTDPAIEDLDAFNARLLRRLVRDTDHVPSSTVVNGRFAIRPCFLSPRTTHDDVADLVESVIAIGDELRGR